MTVRLYLRIAPPHRRKHNTLAIVTTRPSYRMLGTDRPTVGFALDVTIPDKLLGNQIFAVGLPLDETISVEVPVDRIH